MSLDTLNTDKSVQNGNLPSLRISDPITKELLTNILLELKLLNARIEETYETSVREKDIK